MESIQKLIDRKFYQLETGTWIFLDCRAPGNRVNWLDLTQSRIISIGLLPKTKNNLDRFALSLTEII